jgi:putative restriction endonuclease
MEGFFGTPRGVAVDQVFDDRRALHDAHMHRPLQAGISGTASEGADSIVLSGGYSDDEDYGDSITYTGHGGRDQSSGRQTAHQSPDASGNAGLITSRIQGLPVRVIRGSKWKSPFSPTHGYQFAGLYQVAHYWQEKGLDGFVVMRFQLERMRDAAFIDVIDQPQLSIEYATSTVSRRIRDTALARHVNALYKDECQVCGVGVPGVSGRVYSEGAHVRPLGRPHLGADSVDNVLCLCPNHHVQLDIGGMVILDDFTVAPHRTSEPFGELRFNGKHRLDLTHVRYHRELWQLEPTF